MEKPVQVYSSSLPWSLESISEDPRACPVLFGSSTIRITEKGDMLCDTGKVA